MLALSVVLVALIQGVFSTCPEIRNSERRGYPVGSTLEVSCPGITSLTYIVTCTDADLWDHSLVGSSCSGNFPAAPSVALPAPTITIATAPPASPAPTCPFIGGFMRAADAGRTYPQGVVYDMICSANGGTFPATCQNGAWVYRINACPGIGQPPPTTTTTSVISTSSSVRCPYLPGYMEEDAYSINFGEGDLYQMTCNPPNEARRFEAVCRNGQWFGNVRTCRSTGTGLFGNLFNRQQPATTAATQPPRRCPYLRTRMLETDAGKTFPHGTQYRLRCVELNSVATSVLATCVDGTWSYNPNDCFRRPSTFQNGLQIGNTNIPIWFFLLQG